ncbi:hypothetical protein EPL05_15785 [Mucilaginibacter gilvus]|uniref:Uncharacterized protein n=1 Tax=Mucilaginibacter gilvus TaxID=2305909 RepID=A0A3S3UTP9_9SPHI|nr:hypothetical protein EPL05_15785 [Mucilaginibacter gilvus]
MNTKITMAAAAVFLGFIGIALTFSPNEAAAMAGLQINQVWQVVLQVLGGLYFSFAIINWMAKGAAIGGIYNKPILMGNLSHFVITAITLVKLTLNNHELHYSVYLLTGIYAVFAILFGMMLFRSPV